MKRPYYKNTRDMVLLCVYLLQALVLKKQP